MNVSHNMTDSVNGKITVKVTADDYADKVKSELKKIANNRPLPGFRKGHVPMQLLEKQFGREVKSDVINRVVYDSVVKYIEDNKLNIIGQPLPEKMVEVSMEQPDYEFTYVIAGAPQFDIKIDKSMKMPYYNITVSDEMVAEQDKALCERFGSQGPGEEADARAVIKGVMMEVAPEEGKEAIAVENAIVGPFTFVDKEEADKFLGKKIGDKVVFNPYKSEGGNAQKMASLLNMDAEQAKDVKGDFEFTISEIIVAKPAEHGQQLYDDVFGKDKVTTEEQYLEGVKGMIAQSLANDSRQVFNMMARKQLLADTANAAMPVDFLKQYMIAVDSNVTPENVDEQYNQAAESFRWQLLKDEIGKQLKVAVNEADQLEFAKMVTRNQLAQYGITNLDDATIEQYAKRLLEDRKQTAQISEQVYDLKLFQAIHDAVTLEDKSVTLDELNEILKKDGLSE